MRDFAKLLNELYFTHSDLSKLALLKNYFATTPDPIRGYALGIIAGTLNFKILTRNLLKGLITQKIDPILFQRSYDYVGDLAETISLLWPAPLSSSSAKLPLLDKLVILFETATKEKATHTLSQLLDEMEIDERWALLKIATGSLRIGVSARFAKQALAEYGNKTVHQIEEIWHATSPPYENLFAWLEQKGEKPHLGDKTFFHPVMLSHPLVTENLPVITPADFFVEWKYDGIRIQIVVTPTQHCLYSRTGDDISQSFPDIIQSPLMPVVLDGELVIKIDNTIGSFNDLQQRLNKKNPTKKFMLRAPAHVIVYDILSINGEDLRHLPLIERRVFLQKWFQEAYPENMSLSPLLDFFSTDELIALRDQVITHLHPAIEGLMLKRKKSIYVAGRPSNQWYKWKRDPFLVDAVLMYAQRGHGKRSSFYSDYTFGLWRGKQLLPIGKAYFGFTNEELKQLDKWIRAHTLQKFGPVLEVEKELVLEIAFDAVQTSKRHKSGYALRFPRIYRIRWDKPTTEADQLEVLKKLITENKISA